MSGEDNSAVMNQLGKLDGQMQMLMSVMQSNNASTHQRIDDMRAAIAGQLDSVEKRLGTLEANERSTAVKASSAGAIAGVIAAAGVAALKGVLGVGH